MKWTRVQCSSERHALQQLLHTRCGWQVAVGNKGWTSRKYILGKLYNKEKGTHTIDKGRRYIVRDKPHLYNVIFSDGVNLLVSGGQRSVFFFQGHLVGIRNWTDVFLYVIPWQWSARLVSPELQCHQIGRRIAQQPWGSQPWAGSWRIK